MSNLTGSNFGSTASTPGAMISRRGRGSSLASRSSSRQSPRTLCTHLLINTSDADILDKGDGQPRVQLHLKITNTGALINKINSGTRGGRGRGKDRNVTYNLSILFVTSRNDRFLRYMNLK